MERETEMEIESEGGSTQTTTCNVCVGGISVDFRRSEVLFLWLQVVLVRYTLSRSESVGKRQQLSTVMNDIE